MKTPQKKSVTLRTRKGTLIYKTPTGYRYKVIRAGRQHYFPLGIDVERAKKRADDIRDHLAIHSVDEVRAKFHPKHISKVSAKNETVENLLIAHEAIASSLGIRKRTAKDYRRGLLFVIREAFDISKAQALKLNVSALNESLVWKAKQNYLNKRNIFDNACKRTFNSHLRNAQSVFTKDAISAYKGYEPTWDFSAVREAFQKADQFKRVKKKWKCPSEGMINNIHWNLENVAGGELYTILALAFYGGLRCSEISAMQWSWCSDTSPSSPDDVKIDVISAGNFNAKGRQGYTIMKRTQWQRILDRKTAFGTCLVRYNSPRVISQKASEFLRKTCNLNVQKPLHELRKICGAYFASVHGLYGAQLYLRHEDPKTTFDHYSGVILSDTCLTLWDN